MLNEGSGQDRILHDNDNDDGLDGWVIDDNVYDVGVSYFRENEK